MTSMSNVAWRFGLLSAALLMAAPAAAGAQSVTWNWTSTTCGGNPQGAFLEEQTFSVAPAGTG